MELLKSSSLLYLFFWTAPVSISTVSILFFSYHWLALIQVAIHQHPFPLFYFISTFSLACYYYNFLCLFYHTRCFCCLPFLSYPTTSFFFIFKLFSLSFSNQPTIPFFAFSLFLANIGQVVQ